MQIHIDDSFNLSSQATAAGFASVNHYIQHLLDRDRERLAIQEGLDDVKHGRTQDLEDFDRDFREKNSIPQAD
ncbi:hypothetical protein [Aeoliella mucimassa]|uniref:Uncharacterized protein n=1 Tax=Aeoliella mucimassa TaxID=2527972 RepID=A0A518AT17_9BACT|nr:hypothetical protein [Aeoliella mucimassa]QDU57865.1 hypothetical protein Pan181_40880 [Aeoliella mucimassa]